jgi:hypothetical protein
VYSKLIAGIAVSNSADGMGVICCVLAGSGLSKGVITRLEQSYRL